MIWSALILALVFGFLRVWLGTKEEVITELFGATWARRPIRVICIILIVTLFAVPVLVVQGPWHLAAYAVVSGSGWAWLFGPSRWSVDPLYRTTKFMDDHVPVFWWRGIPVIDGWWNYCEALCGAAVGALAGVAASW